MECEHKQIKEYKLHHGKDVLIAKCCVKCGMIFSMNYKIKPSYGFYSPKNKV